MKIVVSSEEMKATVTVRLHAELEEKTSKDGNEYQQIHIWGENVEDEGISAIHEWFFPDTMLTSPWGQFIARLESQGWNGKGKTLDDLDGFIAVMEQVPAKELGLTKGKMAYWMPKVGEKAEGVPDIEEELLEVLKKNPTRDDIEAWRVENGIRKQDIAPIINKLVSDGKVTKDGAKYVYIGGSE